MEAAPTLIKGRSLATKYIIRQKEKRYRIAKLNRHQYNRPIAKQYQTFLPKQNPTFQELGLQGLSEACNYQLPIPKRLFWGILWTAMWICCIAQCVACLKLYISSPTVTSFSYQKTRTITPPCVTFCSFDNDKGETPAIWKALLKEMFSDVSYHNVSDLLRKTNMSLETLWNISTFTVERLTIDLWEVDGYMYDFMEQMELVTVVGICLTFKPVKQLPCTGEKAELVFTGYGSTPLTEETNDTALLIMFHSEAEMPLLRYYGPYANGVFVPYKTLVISALHIEEFRYENSWNNPCSSTDEYYQCQSDCFDSIIQKESKLSRVCRLPFMKDTKLPLCRSATEFDEMRSATKLAAKKMNDNDDHCKCPNNPCQKIGFVEDYVSMKPLTKYLFRIEVFFPQCKLHVVQEEYSYRTVNFISDVGGTMGICLGMSVLSIVGIMETILLKLFRRG